MATIRRTRYSAGISDQGRLTVFKQRRNPPHTKEDAMFTRWHRPALRRLIPVLASASLVGFMLAVPTAFGKVVFNTIDGAPLVTDGGRHIVITGPLSCTAGERAFLRVTVTQRETGAIAEGHNPGSLLGRHPAVGSPRDSSRGGRLPTRTGNCRSVSSHVSARRHQRFASVAREYHLGRRLAGAHRRIE